MRRVLISWGRSSLIGLLVFMSVVVVLVLLLYSFTVDGGSGGVPVHLFFVVCYSFLYTVRITAHIASHLGSQMRAATL